MCQTYLIVVYLNYVSLSMLDKNKTQSDLKINEYQWKEGCELSER